MEEIKEGELYKVIDVFGRKIELRYGYYEERERGRGEPIPIYPDFKKDPVYTDDGFPLVTQMQELCEAGSSPYADGYCVDCAHYMHCTDLVGICKNKKNKKNTPKGEEK